MFGEEKKLKDTQEDSMKDTSSMSVPYQVAGFGSGSYTKTNKLITALYMVTDIIDKDEPLRNKLRTLGIEIISDINSSPSNAFGKISEIMSFLDIATAINIVSEMNCSILRKEFLELDQSIKEAINKKPAWIANFLNENTDENFVATLPREKGINKGHTNIGVQKGNTLLNAIKKMSNSGPAPYVPSGRDRSGSDRKTSRAGTDSFDMLKKQRRGEIIDLIQKRGGSATITDIKNGAYGSLVSCGEKTLQRELVSMVKDDVLNKMGEKRWSRYFIK